MKKKIVLTKGIAGQYECRIAELLVKKIVKWEQRKYLKVNCDV